MKLNLAIERHLTITDTKFLAGDTLTASDFHFFSHVTAFALNKNMNHKNVFEALATTHGTYRTPKLNAWVERMQNELKDHLAKRPAYIL
jgi:glutathione S-transferase